MQRALRSGAFPTASGTPTYPVLRIIGREPPRELLGPLDQQELAVLIAHAHNGVRPAPRDLPEHPHEQPLVVDRIRHVRVPLDMHAA